MEGLFPDGPFGILESPDGDTIPKWPQAPQALIQAGCREAGIDHVVGAI